MVGRESWQHNSLLSNELAIKCECTLKTKKCAFFARKECVEYLFEDKSRSFGPDKNHRGAQPVS